MERTNGIAANHFVSLALLVSAWSGCARQTASTASLLAQAMPASSDATVNFSGLSASQASSYQLVFLSSSQSVPQGQCSGLSQIQIQKTSGRAVSSEFNVGILISSAQDPSLEIFSDAQCTQPISPLIVSAGTSSTSFYFKSSAQGPITITAAMDFNPAIAGSQTEELVASPSPSPTPSPSPSPSPTPKPSPSPSPTPTSSPRPSPSPTPSPSPSPSPSPTPSPTSASTPALVYANNLAAPGEPGNNFKIQYGGSMGTGTLADNLLTLRMTYPHGSTLASITDNKSSTYVLGTSTDSGSGGWVTAIYYVPGVAAGITQITIGFSASVADWHGSVMEYSGVATSSPLDGTCSNHGTEIACNAPITTTGSNDLVVSSMIGLGGSIYTNTLSTIAPGSSFFFDAADTQCSDADEEYIQASPGSVTPSFSVTGSSEAFNIVGVAFKSAMAGTRPAGMYILHEQHEQINGPTSTENVYFVSSGNLLVGATDIGEITSTVSIGGCSPSNNWTESTQGTYYPQFFYLTSSAAFSTNLHCTVTTTQVGEHAILVIYDIVGAAASPFDAVSPGTAASGTVLTNFPDITPDSQPGIAFAAEGTGFGPTTEVGTGGFIFDNTPYSGETDGGQLNNGDGWQHLFYSSTSQISFSWTQANSSSYMEAAAISFKAASSSP